VQNLTVTLGNGVRMPQLGFGTWQLDEQAAERATALALRVGFRSVDTSEAYGNERGVGRAVRDSGLAREEVFVTTKVLDREGYDNVLRSFHASLGRLGLEFVDLYLIHWPQDGYTGETWRARPEPSRNRR
jgi:2,5-diketo-D-gluconate reductase A